MIWRKVWSSSLDAVGLISKMTLTKSFSQSQIALQWLKSTMSTQSINYYNKASLHYGHCYQGNNMEEMDQETRSIDNEILLVELLCDLSFASTIQYQLAPFLHHQESLWYQSQWWIPSIAATSSFAPYEPDIQDISAAGSAFLCSSSMISLVSNVVYTWKETNNIIAYPFFQ